MRKYKALHPSAKQQGRERSLVAQKKLAQISKKATQPVIESTDIVALWDIRTTPQQDGPEHSHGTPNRPTLHLSQPLSSTTRVGDSVTSTAPHTSPMQPSLSSATAPGSGAAPSTGKSKRKSTKRGTKRTTTSASRRTKRPRSVRDNSAQAATASTVQPTPTGTTGSTAAPSTGMPTHAPVSTPTDCDAPTPAEQQLALRVFHASEQGCSTGTGTIPSAIPAGCDGSAGASQAMSTTNILHGQHGVSSVTGDACAASAAPTYRNAPLGVNDTGIAVDASAVKTILPPTLGSVTALQSICDALVPTDAHVEISTEELDRIRTLPGLPALEAQFLRLLAWPSVLKSTHAPE